MAAPTVVEVDPSLLHLPTSRLSGADPVKLLRQMAKFGNTTAGMPRPFVVEGPDGAYQLVDGVTRASRVAKLLPGQTIQVEVTGIVRRSFAHVPKVGDTLP